MKPNPKRDPRIAQENRDEKDLEEYRAQISPLLWIYEIILNRLDPQTLEHSQTDALEFRVPVLQLLKTRKRLKLTDYQERRILKRLERLV